MYMTFNILSRATNWWIWTYITSLLEFYRRWHRYLLAFCRRNRHCRLCGRLCMWLHQHVPHTSSGSKAELTSTLCTVPWNNSRSHLTNLLFINSSKCHYLSQRFHQLKLYCQQITHTKKFVLGSRGKYGSKKKVCLNFVILVITLIFNEILPYPPGEPFIQYTSPS